MNQKENLEYYALQNFIAYYNNTHKRKMAFIRQCQPPMPDIICRLERTEVGIEVAHTYGTGEEAAMRLGNRDAKNIPEDIHRTRRLVTVDDRATFSLNQLLMQKSKKLYKHDHLWLVVRNAFLLWSLHDYKLNKKMINIPANHPFRQVWLVCDQNSIGRPGIMRLI